MVQSNHPGMVLDLVREEQLRDRLELHVGRALVDLPDLRVAIELLDRVVLRVAVAAVELYGERGDVLGRLRRVELAHRRLREERALRVAQPRGVVDEEARRGELGRGASDLELDALV